MGRRMTTTPEQEGGHRIRRFQSRADGTKVEVRCYPDEAERTNVDGLDEIVVEDAVGVCLMHLEQQSEDAYWFTAYGVRVVISAVRRGKIGILWELEDDTLEEITP